MPLTKEKKRTLTSLVITLAIGIIFSVLYRLPHLRTIYETLELKTLDLRFILEPRPPVSGKIIHIDIDDESIKKLGWPCPRKYYAYLIDILTECGSRAIIFDIQFEEPSQLAIDRMMSSELREEIAGRINDWEGDTSKISAEVSREASPEKFSSYLSQLKGAVGESLSLLSQKLDKAILDQDKLMAEAIGHGHNIFIPFFFPEEPSGKVTQNEEILFMEKFSLPVFLKKEDRYPYKARFLSPPIEILSRRITGSGFVNAGFLDSDGVMRRIPLFWEYKDKFFPQLSLSTFLTLTKSPEQRIEIVPGKYIKINPEITIPVDKKMQVIIHWAGKWKKDFPRIPFVGIVELKQVREKLEDNLIILDEKYTSGRLNGLKKELELNPAPSAEVLREIEEAKADIFEFLKKNIEKTSLAELKEEYDSIDTPRKQEKEIKARITHSVKGKICFVGLTGTGTHDRRPIPLQPDYPMVGLHSNLMNTILTQKFIRVASPSLNLCLFLLAGLIIALVTPRLSPWRGMIMSLIFLGLFIALAQYLFQSHGLAVNMTGPLGLIVTSFTAITSYRYITEEKEKRWVRRAFSHYLAPRVMEEILADPSKLNLGGTRQDLTVLFSDIRGFTNYCEKRSPEEIIPSLNEYLDIMSKVIFKYNGTLDKYVGDEIVAFYGAPALEKPINHAEMAVRTALEMVEELKKLQEKCRREGKEPFDFGVGINTGPMVVGNMGSSDRLNYTVIGDEVNLGARLEAQTRNFNVRIIISQSTYEKVKDLVEVKELGEVTVKGKAKPVLIYELLSLKK